MNVRPAPRQGRYDGEFWRRVEDRELALQACLPCGHRWYPPGPACPRCLSREWEWRPVAGRGALLSWATFHRQYFPSLPPPYTVVAAVLDEGPILLTDVAVDPRRLRLGMPLHLVYRPAQTEDGTPFTLFHWEPDEDPPGQLGADSGNWSR